VLATLEATAGIGAFSILWMQTSHASHGSWLVIILCTLIASSGVLLAVATIIGTTKPLPPPGG
jgi:hypothetical protein